MTPLEAAMKGAGEIGFTIVSITVSLVAVFIPLLLMGGIVGRLFREFAVTVTVRSLRLGCVSLTLTPMMCAALPAPRPEPAWPALHARARLRPCSRGYARGLDLALRHQLVDPCSCSSRRSRRPVYLFAVIPKGFFPQQDTGLIIGTAEAAQDISFADMCGANRRSPRS